jgi:hypothetical protein
MLLNSKSSNFCGTKAFQAHKAFFEGQAYSSLIFKYL